MGSTVGGTHGGGPQLSLSPLRLQPGQTGQEETHGGGQLRLQGQSGHRL